MTTRFNNHRDELDFGFDQMLDTVRRHVSSRVNVFLAEQRRNWKNNPDWYADCTAEELMSQFFEEQTCGE